MKKLFFLFAASALFTVQAVKAQTTMTTTTTEEHWVTTPPVMPSNANTTRPAQPSPNSVWIEEEWRYNPSASNYEWHGGHWDTPPQPGKKWKKGKWKKTGKGYSWTTGTWY